MVNRQTVNNMTVLHHNIQSLNNKVYELALYLHTRNKMVDVLCLSEHWMAEDQIKLINFDQYILKDFFCSNKRRGGCSCIFVREILSARQVHYLNGIAQEKTFELAAVELLDIKVVIVCIYRSPESDIDEFLGKLEIMIKRTQEHTHTQKKGLLFVGIGMLISVTIIQNY
jgi:exonuclease III